MELITHNQEYERSFIMVDETDHLTGATGLTVVVEISKANTPFVIAEGSVTEVGYGWYKITLSGFDTSILGTLKYHCSAVGADVSDFEDTVTTQEQVNISTVFQTQTDAYVTVQEADDYFASKLDRSIWEIANEDQKQHSINQASEILEELNYAGDKAEDDQPLEFPRGIDTIIPKNMKKACCLIAYALLDGRDPEIEIELIGQTQSSVGNIRGRYDRTFIQEATVYGVPSYQAWRLIKPFLRDSNQVTLNRVS